MDIKENIAGLGKNHDEEARETDLQKKQSSASPSAENIDMEPHSVNKNGSKEFNDQPEENIAKDAANYAEEERQKAKNWESKTD